MRIVDGLFTERMGDGPPMLVMHGGLGFDHCCFRPWLDALAGNATLIYYDHRGNGRSVEPADWDSFGLAEWTADADAVRAAHGADRLVVLAHSCGVFLALEYARRFPERVAGLVLCCGAPALDYPEMDATAHALREMYNLTRTETQLAALLTTGRDLLSAARLMSVSINTARTHLAHPFAKTGTRRQSELVRLLLLAPRGSPVPTPGATVPLLEPPPTRR
jgi:pimeloyl-ACP methyl ester carboxylesterase